MKNRYNLIELPAVDSTNLYAEALLIQQQLGEETVILAHEQTSGKGQGMNRWESEPGKNATFSIILFPRFLPPGRQFMMSKVVALGITDFLFRFQLPVKCSIKWPNDIYAGNRKIGGILIQNTVCGNEYKSCIAGIGVNLNQEVFSSVLPNPVSLKQMTGTEVPVRDAVDQMTGCIDDRYMQLKSGDDGGIDEEYSKRLLGIAQWRDYSVDKMVIKGRIRGVDESGMLLLELESGSLKTFSHGAIGFPVP
jgi:BirA family biotin operon repressor/biotin-[acetyl-CoA-carboxylase] ligase